MEFLRNDTKIEAGFTRFKNELDTGLKGCPVTSLHGYIAPSQFAPNKSQISP